MTSNLIQKKEKNALSTAEAKDKDAGAKNTDGAVASQNTDDAGTSGESSSAEAVAAETGENEKKKRKLPCCFGFISTWLAKRKERRRAKKRQAIEARKSKTPVEPLGK